MVVHHIAVYFSRDITSEFTRFCVSETDAYLVVYYRAYLELLWCHSTTVALWVNLTVPVHAFHRTLRALPASCQIPPLDGSKTICGEHCAARIRSRRVYSLLEGRRRGSSQITLGFLVIV